MLEGAPLWIFGWLVHPVMSEGLYAIDKGLLWMRLMLIRLIWQFVLSMLIVYREEGGYQGMLEYIPGKYAHRPVGADGYMFMQCIFVGFKKEFRGKGYASTLILVHP